MARLSQAKRLELSFFLSEHGRIKYHKKCLACVHDCRQSWKVLEIYCKQYRSKRAKSRTNENEIRARREAESDFEDGT